MAEESANKKRKTTPPDGYICSICSEPGHWIQQCTSSLRTNTKKKKDHIHTPGVDPSQANIDESRELQSIKPPHCFCGISSRLSKVKRSEAGEYSRAIGKYFFFCTKPKLDESKCGFARPVEHETQSKKERLCTFFAKSGRCKKGDKCMFSHDVGLKNTGKPKREKKLVETKQNGKNENRGTTEVEEGKDRSNTEVEVGKDVEKAGNDASSSSSSDSSSDSDSSDSDDDN